MEITTRTSGDCPVLDLNGELLLGPATMKLRKTFREVAKTSKAKIVMNLQNVTCMDTPGLGELVSCLSHARSLGLSLVLLNPQERTMNLLIVTKLRTVFDIFHNEALAVADSRQDSVVA